MVKMGLGIKRLVKSTLKRARGSRSGADSGFRSDILNPFLALLKQLGFAPRHIVDVGSNHGDWTRAAIQFSPGASYALIEPQDHLKSYIQELLDGSAS